MKSSLCRMWVLSAFWFVATRGAEGDMKANLTAQERALFSAGRQAFSTRSSVQGDRFYPGTEAGLGPRYNLDSCGGCHAHPSIGGSSPPRNPQIEAATAFGANNPIPFFVKADGPIYQVRLKGYLVETSGVRGIYTIAGRKDAIGCAAATVDFGAEFRRGNASLRIPAPLYGAGLIEAIPDEVLTANQNSRLGEKRRFGIGGKPNRMSSGALGRFGWKAQIASLEHFAGEAYWSEQGVTNDLFPLEQYGGSKGCNLNTYPEDHFQIAAKNAADGMSNVVRFTYYMRFLDAPPPAGENDAEVSKGERLFEETGCGLCHTRVLATGKSSHVVLANQQVRLYSDLMIHDMGTVLADGVEQGSAGGSWFRTAPLWGVGKRLFLLHDGRSRSLHDAILAHAEGTKGRSEARKSVEKYKNLEPGARTALLRFLQKL